MKNNLLIIVIFSLFFVFHPSGFSQDFTADTIQANILYNQGNYNEAADLFAKWVPVKKEQIKNRTDTLLYAKLLGLTGQCLYYSEKYERAEPIMKEFCTFEKAIAGVNHPDYAGSLNMLGLLYRETGHFKVAEPLLIEALRIIKDQLGETHSYYGSALENLAQLYQMENRYDIAESLYMKAVNVSKMWEKEYPGNYANTLSDLAQFYKETGRYDQAEQIMKLALEKARICFKENQTELSMFINNLAYVLTEMGRYEQAEQLTLQAISNINTQDLDNNPDYALYLNNLAELYKLMGHYDKAEPLLLKAIEIDKIALGVKHPGYATDLNNLATLYNLMGRFDLAEKIFRQVHEIDSITLGEHHHNYALGLSNLAQVYVNTKRYDQAEPLMKKVLEIDKTALGESHPVYARDLDNLANLYQKIGKYSEAEVFFNQGLKVVYYNIDRQFGFLSEKEKELYLKTVLVYISNYQNFCLKSQTSNPGITCQVYNLVLWTKGMLLSSSIQMKQNVLNSGDSILISKYNQWESKKRWLAKLYSIPVMERNVSTDTIEEEANILEKELTQRSRHFTNFQSATKINYLDIKNALKPGEAAIEFSSFKISNMRDRDTDSILYCALVLKNDFEYPQMVPLFEQKQLDALLQKKNISDEGFVSTLYTRGVSMINNQDQLNKGLQLYELCWKPFDSLLAGVKTVYYSSSGMLHKIAFAAIPYNKKILLSEKYNLVCLSSTAKLTEKDQEKFHPKTISLWGGIIYDIDTAQIKVLAQSINNNHSQKELPTYYSSRSLPENLTRSGEWNFLKGTEDEVNILEKLAEKTNIKTKLITGVAANEESLKMISGKNSPDILHIATHGFFFPDPKDSSRNEINNQLQVFRLSDNPLFRSGIIMAGANRAWKGETSPDGVDDGILTAYEVSNMNLQDTKLAVLSACETGLGDIKGSEGVYGLQRAFKIAGVKYLIMSLWKVPDQETVEFMKAFYTKLFSGTSIPDAFTETQRMMQKKYSGDPYKWAAFVLIR